MSVAQRLRAPTGVDNTFSHKGNRAKLSETKLHILDQHWRKNEKRAKLSRAVEERAKLFNKI